MTVTLLQTDIAWNLPQENIQQAEQLMEQAGQADLYVLPEMWATGFTMTPEGTAEDEDSSAALDWMRRQAISRGCALCGSLAVRTADGTFRNRHYMVTPEKTVFYDKHHLFAYGHENEHYTAGSTAVVAEWKGWRLLLQTCYDLRFPVFARYGRPTADTPSSGLFYDAIVYVANWPEKRKLAWDTLIRARAIENQCYVLAVNRVGNDPACHYGGGSAVIDPIGHTLAACDTQMQAVTTAIDMERLQDMRNRFRVLDDRDF